MTSINKMNTTSSSATFVEIAENEPEEHEEEVENKSVKTN